MIYRVRHRTTYDYEDPVSVSHHLGAPDSSQSSGTGLPETRDIHLPAPHITATHNDYFGNIQTFFTLQEPHDSLVVEAMQRIGSPRCETAGFLRVSAVGNVLLSHWSATIARRASTRTSLFSVPSVSERAANSPTTRALRFPQDRPLLEASSRSHARNHIAILRFDTEATEVTTPVQAFFEKRRGVCQDFAHLQIACIRSLGLPARYISGYLRTLPPPGKPRLVGADASHAWCSVWSPGCRMDRFRSHEQLHPHGRSHHGGMGTRL